MALTIDLDDETWVMTIEIYDDKRSYPISLKENWMMTIEFCVEELPVSHCLPEQLLASSRTPA
jgi:hypothetical protein